MMKALVLFFFFICSQTTALTQFGQSSIYDTIYHPFYNGVQLVELKLHNQTVAKKGFVMTSKVAFTKFIAPKYALRNGWGKILRSYNDFDNSLTAHTLRAKNEVEALLKYHKLKTKNTSRYAGVDDSGYNIAYPIYECIANEKGPCAKVKVGLLDTLGTIVLPIEYDEIKWTDSVFICVKEGKYTMYDHTFKLVLEDYDEINYIRTHSDHIKVRKNGKCGLIHRNGTQLLPMEYDEFLVSEYMHGYYEFRVGNKWGFINFALQRKLDPFSPSPKLLRRDGHFITYDENKQWILLDSTGKVLLYSPHEVYRVLSDHRFLVTKWVRDEGYERSICDQFGNIISDKIYYHLCRVNSTTLFGGYDAKLNWNKSFKVPSKWVLLDENGVRKNSTVYKYLLNIDDKWLKAKVKKGEMRVIDEDGHDIFGYPINNIGQHSKHVFEVKKDDKYFYVDLANPQHTSDAYDKVHAARENRAAVSKDGKWGFIDVHTYNEIFPLIADRIGHFENGVATVSVNGEVSLIDTTGAYISKENYERVYRLSGGYTKVVRNDSIGILDSKGNYVIPPIYSEMRFFAEHNGEYFIGVKKNDLYGVVNLKNETIYPFKFNTCHELTYHAAAKYQRKDGFYAFLTIEKKEVIERYYMNFNPQLSETVSVANPTRGFKIVTEACILNDKGLCYGVEDWSGKRVIPCEYMYIKTDKYATFRIATPQGLGLMDSKGNVLIPAKYNKLNDLGGDSKLMRVGRHTGLWGLYDYSGNMIVDTLYGGYEKPVFGLIPFYASFNYQYVKKEGWVHDEKKIGFMNLKGEVIIDNIYDSYRIPDRNKEEIELRKGNERILINRKGEILKTEIQSSPPIEPEKTKKPVKSKKKKRKKHKVRWL